MRLRLHAFRHRPGEDDFAAAVAAFRAQIHDPVRFGHDVEVVFDDEHGVAGVDEAMEDVDEFFDVGHVQAHCRFVEHVERVRCPCFSARGGVGLHFHQLGDELDALGFAAGERG